MITLILIVIIAWKTNIVLAIVAVTLFNLAKAIVLATIRKQHKTGATS